MAGANSMFYGGRLLTTDNPDESHDQRLFARLGIAPEASVCRTRHAAETREAFAVT
jgi:biotin synthase